VFALNLKIASSALTLDGVALTPDQIKVDVEINNFPYNSSSTSGLALVARMQSRLKAKKFRDDDSGATNSVDLEGDAGNLSWITSFTSDGVTKNIKSSSLQSDTAEVDDSDSESENESAVKIIWSFPGTASVKKVFWDPSVGVATIDTSSAVKPAVAAFISVFMIIFALVF